MLSVFIFNFDPILVRLGPVAIHYYGIVFVLTLLVAYVFWRLQMIRGGYSRELADSFVLWGTVATLVGARLGHCLFYDPGHYLADPVTMLYFWEGGLSSHGATIGLVLALLIFARVHRLRALEVMDRFTMSAAVGAAGIRLGNFLNSEIVGRVTTVPWAVHFMRYKGDDGAMARHPSQLYEFAMGLFVLLLLYLADRWAGKEKRPLGLMTGLFFTVYFAGRFVVEFFKEFQTPWEKVLTMGQLLSIVPFLFGVVLLILTWTRPRATGAPELTTNVPPQKRRKGSKK
jgi:prolipoprotein diacylglyceryl transferase